MTEKKTYKLKITCFTPKGKAEAASKTFKAYFGVVKEPDSVEIVSDSEFNYIYSYDKEKDMLKVINQKVPKASTAIRNTYGILIHLIKRGNNMVKKGQRSIGRIKRWIISSFTDKVGEENAKAFEDFTENLSLAEDIEEMSKFILGELIRAEILENGGENK